MTGSFVRGTGRGYSDSSEVVHDTEHNLMKAAVAASPALDAFRRPLRNSFALHVNGHREEAPDLLPSEAPDAPDTNLTWHAAPTPASESDDHIIHKTGSVEPGEVTPAPSGTDTRITRTASGRSRLLDSSAIENDIWLEMPGVSHFALRRSWAGTDHKAPSGLALCSAGEEEHGNLLRVAAQTCYLHATLVASMPPVLVYRP